MLLLSDLDEGGKIVLSAEFIDTGFWLVHVPEDIGGNRVESHRTRHADPVAPILAWNASVMNLTRKNLERLAIELEVAADHLEGVRLRWMLCRANLPKQTEERK